jgi:sugar phosphate isomerase/epimerase
MKKYYNFLPLISIAVFIASNSPIIRPSFENDDAHRGNPKWKTGVALYSFNKFSFADAISKADSAGVKYVEGFSFHALGKEFDDNTMATVSREEIRKMKEMMDKNSIKMPSMYVGGGKDEKEWKLFFNTAKALGMQYLVCEPQKDHWNMLDSLAGLYKISIAIHQHAKGSSLYWHPDSVLAAIQGHPNIGACADLGHWARSGLDPVQCLQQLEGHILGIHLKDIDEVNVKANDVVLGTGIINYPDVIRELKRQNFKGMMYVECEHKMEDNLPDVVQAIRYLDDLAKKQ